MQPDIARRCKNALEAPHAMIYFAPEAEQEFGSLGLKGGRIAYFAGRAAPMGAVGAGVVAATFYNFSPRAAAKEIPRAWSIAAPEEIVAARFRAADTALRRMLGDEVLTSEAVTESVQLAAEACRACEPAGKPLFAAHADLEWPEAPHLRLWHALSLLREFRGDAHIAALQAAGITGLQALVLHTATGEGFTEAAAKMTRGWSDEEWSDAHEELRAEGLLDTEGTLTTAGKELREEVEATTDAQSMAPWTHLGATKVERLVAHGAELSKGLAKAGAFPRELFAAGSSRRE
ncbi:SCO6745 family protein [Haloactinomyces albus]